VRIDLFTSVIDNFGDAGIAYALSYALSCYADMDVRLFIDRTDILFHLVPEDQVTPGHLSSSLTIKSYADACDPSFYTDSSFRVADCVIAVIAGTVPDIYLDQMEQSSASCPYFLYEYLTFEPWAQDTHLLPSHHPSRNITQYYFYPGALDRMGGILFAPNEKPIPLPFDRKSAGQNIFRVLIFCYDTPVLLTLVQACAHAMPGTHFTVMKGPVADRLIQAQDQIEKGTIETSPFVPQNQFNNLLGAHDMVIVRGEDSLTRALVAGRPLIWHIYPQDDHAHLEKIKAFCEWYTQGWPEEAQKTLLDTHLILNDFIPQDRAKDMINALFLNKDLWADTAQKHAHTLQKKGSAAQNLVDFWQKLR
jgi:uncharacterized repeat protein (TIGR03837 family)